MDVSGQFHGPAILPPVMIPQFLLSSRLTGGPRTGTGASEKCEQTSLVHEENGIAVPLTSSPKPIHYIGYPISTLFFYPYVYLFVVTL